MPLVQKVLSCFTFLTLFACLCQDDSVATIIKDGMSGAFDMADAGSKAFGERHTGDANIRNLYLWLFGDKTTSDHESEILGKVVHVFADAH